MDHWQTPDGGRHSGGEPLEDDRQSAPFPAGPDDPRQPACRLAAAAAASPGLDGGGSGAVRPATADGTAFRHSAGPRRHHRAQPLSGAAGRYHGCPGADRLVHHLAGRHGRANAGCHCPHPDPPGHRSAFAGMADGGPGQWCQPAVLCRAIYASGARGGAGAVHLRLGLCAEPARLAIAPGLCRDLACCASRCPPDQPAARAPRCRAADRGGAGQFAPDRPPHLALFRGLRDRSQQLPAPGQLSGNPAARAGAAHLAHQYRAVPAVGDGGAGHGLDRAGRGGDAAGTDPGHHAADGAVSRPSAQLA